MAWYHSPVMMVFFTISQCTSYTLISLLFFNNRAFSKSHLKQDVARSTECIVSCLPYPALSASFGPTHLTSATECFHTHCSLDNLHITISFILAHSTNRTQGFISMLFLSNYALINKATDDHQPPISHLHAEMSIGAILSPGS